MTKFRQKIYTIQEGHYTGPKQETIPSAAEMAMKGGAGGILLGAVKGYLDNHEEMGTLNSMASGAMSGYVKGALLGLAIKVGREYINKPLSDINAQNLDRNIRREFGMYKIPGINLTVGDNSSNRSNMIDKVSYNSKDITAFKINFGIQKNKIVMYTFALTDDELNRLSSILDRYVQENTNMAYNASLINKAQNSYAVAITFTTYNIASKFIVEVANELNTRVNVLDRDSYIASNAEQFTKTREENIKNFEEEPKEEAPDYFTNRNFSVNEISKYDAADILKSAGTGAITGMRLGGFRSSVAYGLMGLIQGAIIKMSNNIKVRRGMAAPRDSFNNTYLEDTLKKQLRLVEGFHYTVGDDKAKNNIAMNHGIFVVTCEKNSMDQSKIDKAFYQSNKDLVNKRDVDNVTTYTYYINSRNEFETLLKKLFSTRITFNVFQ